MKYTKKIFKDNWRKDIEDFAYKLQYPFDENSGCKLVPETTFKRGYNKSIVS